MTGDVRVPNSSYPGASPGYPVNDPPTLDTRLSPAVSTSPSRGEVVQSASTYSPPSEGEGQGGGE